RKWSVKLRLTRKCLQSTLDNLLRAAVVRCASRHSFICSCPSGMSKKRKPKTEGAEETKAAPLDSLGRVAWASPAPPVSLVTVRNAANEVWVVKRLHPAKPSALAADLPTYAVTVLDLTLGVMRRQVRL